MNVNLQPYVKSASPAACPNGGHAANLEAHVPHELPKSDDRQCPLPRQSRGQLEKGRHIGTYALTTKLASWVEAAIAHYQPTSDVVELVAPFAAELHDVFEKERSLSTGLHDIDALELTYQFTVQVGAAIVLAADSTDDPVDFALQLHASKAGGDEHFKSWGRLLTGLDCDPPIIVQFPFYLMMCQSFTFEPLGHREDYVYSALTGVDWVSSD